MGNMSKSSGKVLFYLGNLTAMGGIFSARFDIIFAKFLLGNFFSKFTSILRGRK